MSNSPVIPREKLSAYQRWELHSFDLPGNMAAPARAADRAAEEAAKAEAIRLAAYQSGHADGLREGRNKAHDDARRLKALLAEVSRQNKALNQQLADDLLKLSLELARQMVRRNLTVHPEVILPLVQDAVAQLANAKTPLTIALHPADAALVREQLPSAPDTEHWQITENAALSRGSCLLHSAHSHLDGTLATRWQHLTARLGVDDTWLD